ncbi:hypothetical protein PVAP13_1KG333600 [Panicum virgatum]|uniref:TPX2 C-terminal domain-containing protein n=1 Tax=Panicum virgatum TaxID=38727 RepID=A0A8T0XCA8_PANVG|nr:hypothetical protein PVAP13_1KG333600 [Panicum virgatum]
MAADVGQRFSGWSCSDLPYNDHSTQDSSVQQMVLNHGSISFGRFAAESLSWEKRSVFEHNRRQEEISKLTAPGLVAQKKAFFEEYFKRARQLKAQGAMHQTEATMDERNDDSTLGHSSQVDELHEDMSEDPVASAPSSSSEPITEVNSSDERNCQDGHELGYLTFNPLFSQTASLQNIQEEERSSSGQKQYPCAAQTSSNNGFSCEAIERKILAPKRVVSNDNGESNVTGTRIVLPIASLQPEGLEVGHEKHAARKSVAIVNRSMKIVKDLPTSVIHTQRVDLRSNSENKPSQDLKDPFHKRVEMKLCALSDRWDADRSAASSRSASYQHAGRAITSCRSSHQNNDRVATSSSSSLCQNTDRVLAPSKLAAQAPQKYLNGVQRSNARGISFNKGSNASHVASCNSTATGKLAAKTLAMPSSSQVSARTSKTAQVTLKRSARLTSINDGSKNKRKQLSTPAALDENSRKRGYVRASASLSARSSSENYPPTAKAPKISNMTNVVAKVKPMRSEMIVHNYLFPGNGERSNLLVDSIYIVLRWTA